MSKIRASIRLDIPVGRIDSLEDVLAFLLRLEVWDSERTDRCQFPISRRRTDVRGEQEQELVADRNGRDGLL